ncbi:hypothetical protein GGI21_004488, partial [Coemansia aciculifera]
GNAFGDGHYLAGLAAAAANAVAQSTRFASGQAAADALAEVERLRVLDGLATSSTAPSFHNVVTSAALEALLRVSLAQRRRGGFNTALFAAMAGARNSARVRRSAISGLLLHWGLAQPIVMRLAVSVAGDPEHPRLAVDLAQHIAQLVMVRAVSLGKTHHGLLLSESLDSGHVDAPARLVGGFEALADDDSLGDCAELRVLLAASAYDSAVPPSARRVLAAVHALAYQTVDESVPPRAPPPRRRLKIRIQPKTGADQINKPLLPPPHPSSSHPQISSSAQSSDSEDTPLAASLVPVKLKQQRKKYQRKNPLLLLKKPLSLSDEHVSIDDDNDILLPPPPPLAGTRPPPITVSDASLNSPVYTEPPPPPSAKQETTSPAPSSLPSPLTTLPPLPPIKLKLKLSKATSSAVLDTISIGKSPLSKEITSANDEATPTTATTSTMAAEETKRLSAVLRKVSRHPDAFPFMRPVDVLLDGCPTYYDVVKQPMDLGTVKRKLESGQYSNSKQFESDVRLMLDNCYLFNPPGTPVYLMGQAVQR